MTGPDVLFVSVTGDYYGAPRSMHLLVDGLRTKGFHMEAALAAPGVLVGQLERSTLRVVVSPADPYTPVRLSKGLGWASPFVKFWRRLRWGWWLTRLVRERRPKMVYVNSLRGGTAALAAWLNRTPILWHLRGVETGTGNRFFRGLRLQLVRHLATRVIAVSDAVAEVARNAGCPPWRLTTVYNGIDSQAAQLRESDASGDARFELSATPADVVVSYVGRLDPHKGILDFLAAAALLVNRQHALRFALIGGPVGAVENLDWPSIETSLNTCPELRARVTLTGFTQHPYALMRASDIIVLPSHDEGFPRTVLEAMALGRAIVATAVGGIPEAITDGQHALLVPPKQPAALAAAIERLAADVALRERLGAAAAQRVLQTFTLESTAEGVATVIRAVQGG